MPIFQKPSRHDPLFCAIDIVEFPAQAISAYEPALRDKPFIVTCQDPQSHKSAVWACSAQALKLGIRRGAPVTLVAKRFPQVVPVVRRKAWENAVIDELKRVFDRYSPQFYISDFGASLIDITATPASRALKPRQIAETIQTEVLKAVALDSLAIGMGRLAVAARLLAKKARPDGICIGEAENELDMLGAMESRLLPGISNAAKERLAAYGLMSIGQIRSLGKEALVRRFGREGEKIYALSLGHYMNANNAPAPAPLVAETVLERDINDMKRLFDRVRLIADKLCFLLKSQNRFVDRFTFQLTYCDNKAVQRTIQLQCFTNDYHAIASRACDAFVELYQRRVAVKSLRLAAMRPHVDPGQTELFETENDRKQRSLGLQLTKVREKCGFEAVKIGSQLEY